MTLYYEIFSLNDLGRQLKLQITSLQQKYFTFFQGSKRSKISWRFLSKYFQLLRVPTVKMTNLLGTAPILVKWDVKATAVPVLVAINSLTRNTFVLLVIQLWNMCYEIRQCIVDECTSSALQVLQLSWTYEIEPQLYRNIVLAKQSKANIFIFTTFLASTQYYSEVQSEGADNTDRLVVYLAQFAAFWCRSSYGNIKISFIDEKHFIQTDQRELGFGYC